MRLTDTPPVRCSACFGQYVDRRHVDFEVAWEGPTFNEGIAGRDGEITNTIAVSVDDLIICEECMKAAGKLLDLEESDVLLENMEQVERQRDELLERVRGLEDQAKSLKAALASEGELAGAAR